MTTVEQVQKAVAEAMKEAMARNGAATRLLPFTAAEIRFIQDVVAGALARVLVVDTQEQGGPTA
ncbi:MAG: hypothetical protein HYY00_00475 [Chloroflexi bacterium]|nr:hypothetical protein [Chloroflexota bacterium]